MDLLKQKRSQIPAVTHVDGTSRLQTVDDKTNPLYFQLISEFHKITGCPMLINTSFNVRGEPIVESPTDAYFCFMGTNIDILVLGSYVILKEDQSKFEDEKRWKEKLIQD